MKIKNITLCLENCDCITIDGKYIGDFIVDDLHTCFRRVACNAIEKLDIADTIVLEIHKDANKERYQFDQVDCENFKQMTFDRLTGCNDITSIQFELEEDYKGQVSNTYNYYTHWTGDSEYINAAQTSYISKDGHLYIIIADGKTVKDFFDIEEINDSDSVDFHFRMYEVGDANQ